MSYNPDTINRQKLALKQLEVITNEISYLTKQDPFFERVIDSLCMFSRDLDDIVRELRNYNSL